MSDGIVIALIGGTGTVAGIIITLITARWRNRTDTDINDRNRLLDFLEGELTHCRAQLARREEEIDRWRSLTWSSLDTAEETLRVVEFYPEER